MGFLSSALSGVWSFAKAAVTSGYDKLESFADVVAGGLTVSSEDWSEAFDVMEQQKEVWGAIKAIPETYRVKGEFGLQSELDWRDKHVMTMKVEAYDFDTGETSERWITVENDTELTRAEWNDLAFSEFGDADTGGYLDIYSILDYEYYIRA